MSKGGFARAAQALAPRVAQALYKLCKSDRIHSFDIRYFLFVIRYSLLGGQFVAGRAAEIRHFARFFYKLDILA